MRLRAPVVPTVERTPDAALLAPDLWPLADVSHNEWRTWLRVFDGWLTNVLYWELTRTRLPAPLAMRTGGAWVTRSSRGCHSSTIAWSNWRLRCPTPRSSTAAGRSTPCARALDGLLPASVVWRRDKKGFPARSATGCAMDAGKRRSTAARGHDAVATLSSAGARADHPGPRQWPDRPLAVVVARAEHGTVAAGVRPVKVLSIAHNAVAASTGGASRPCGADPRRGRAAHPGVVERGGRRIDVPRDAPWGSGTRWPPGMGRGTSTRAVCSRRSNGDAGRDRPVRGAVQPGCVANAFWPRGFRPAGGAGVVFGGQRSAHLAGALSVD